MVYHSDQSIDENFTCDPILPLLVKSSACLQVDRRPRGLEKAVSESVLI